jgi:hypothetical protein
VNDLAGSIQILERADITMARLRTFVESDHGLSRRYDGTENRELTAYEFKVSQLLQRSLSAAATAVCNQLESVEVMLTELERLMDENT